MSISRTKSNTLNKSDKSQGVIFDLDGTLIDTAQDLAASMNHVLVNQGHAPIAHQEVRHLVGFGAKAMLKAGFEKSCAYTPSTKELDELATDFVSYYHTHIADFSAPFPYVIETLEALLKNNISLAICTNKNETLARTLLSALNLTDYFAAIVGGDTAGIAKPDPAPINLCLSQMGFAIAPSHAKSSSDENRDIGHKPISLDQSVIFVGDSDTDIKAALATNLPCLIADFGYGPLDYIGQVNQTFSSYKDAPNIITQMLEMSI